MDFTSLWKISIHDVCDVYMDSIEENLDLTVPDWNSVCVKLNGHVFK